MFWNTAKCFCYFVERCLFKSGTSLTWYGNLCLIAMITTIISAATNIIIAIMKAMIFIFTAFNNNNNSNDNNNSSNSSNSFVLEHLGT